MKLYKPPKPQKPQAKDLKRLVRAFELVTNTLNDVLRTNTVISKDELDSVVSNSSDTLEVLRGVLSRTVLSLSESSELSRLDDVQLGVKFDRQQNEVLYLTDVATALLDRLFNLRHISEKQYHSLDRYWRSIPAQHQLLLDRWEKARVS